jgi:Xaa-Pro dipeptidase
MALDVSLLRKAMNHLTLLDHVGLEVHDVGDGSDRLNLLSGHRSANTWVAAYSNEHLDPVMPTGTTLLPNMVITIEPGM